MPSLPLRRALLLAAATGLCVSTGAHSGPPHDPLRDLSRVLLDDTVAFAPRLSVLSSDRSTRDIGLSAARRRLARLRASDGGTAAAGLHASALIHLLYSRPGDVAQVNRAITLLHTVRSLRPSDAKVLADLSAAYLERAERVHTFADLPRAVQSASDAVGLDSGNADARYNLALALDRMALNDRARAAWEAVAAGSTEPRIVQEARNRARILRTPRMQRPADAAPPARWAAYAAREPQHARLYAMETLLGRWGDAVSAGDSLAARPRLAAAEAVGNALERGNGDPSLAEQVRSIHAAAGHRERTRALARAHAQYGRAQALLDLRQASAARSALDSARAGAAASPPLREWLAYWRGVALFYDGQTDSAAFRRAVARGEARGYPALAARAHWSLATIRIRAGSFDVARAHMARAAFLYDSLGEREHLGGIQALEAETRLDLGDDAAGHAAARAALETLRPYRESVRLHNLLMALGRVASLEGLSAAAAALHDEDVAVAARIRAAVHREALLSRARNAAAAGDLSRAEADLKTVDALLRSEVRVSGTQRPAGTSFEQKWLEADLREGFARVKVRTDPAAAADSLDAVVRFFGGEGLAVSRLLPALVFRAEARLAADDAEGALDDLDRAAVILDTMSAKLASPSLRAAVLNAGRRVFDRLTLLRAGNPGAALAALERGRVSFGHGRRSRQGVRGRLAAPAGTVVVDYALVGDTLLAFTVSDTTVRLVKRHVESAPLLRAAEHARVSMELRAPADSVLPDLALLYDALVRPVRARLRAGVRLVIVADGELAGIPFQALRDSARGRYLLQDHEIRFASSLADALGEDRPRGPGGRALFVADPAFRASDHPGLQRLSGLAAETREIASRYPGGATLSDTSARPSALLRRLRSTDLFHFAGHAVFDDGRPERSYLLLAPDGPRDDGRLTAEEIAAMNLGGVRLVVLSACETQRSVSGRAGGFAGLSGAMLAAGAGGVIGSLWRVDDAYTRALMLEFHRAYLASGAAAAALHQAQLRLLASPDPSLRSPAAWAGFRYAGAGQP